MSVEISKNNNKKDISIVVPFYQAAKILIKNINKLEKYLTDKKLNYEIILIDDGSTDNYNDDLLLISKNKKIILLKNASNIGKSYSVIKGLKKTKFNFVILIDIDLPYFNYLDDIINNLFNKNNDLVIINRGLEESKFIGKDFNFYIFMRIIIGKSINFIIRKSLKISISDTQSGLKAFKKNKNLNYHKFNSKKFFFDVELIYLFEKNNLKIKSIPVNYKIEKKSSISLYKPFQNLIIILELITIIFKIKKK